jgi:alpha-1,3-glucosyltransferase
MQAQARLRACALIGLAALVCRAATSLHPYSGEATPPMYGDYEAQRHWMEITLAFPPSLWYREVPGNNLTYWGLDYPPLSGYASYAVGRVLRRVEPAAVALETSHGFESPVSRAVMRASVLVADALIFFPAVAVCAFSRRGGGERTVAANPEGVLAFALFLPALVLVDHGHFQYNGVSLGLFVASVASMLNDWHAAGAGLFCLSVYFKQMSLYYVPVVATSLLAVMARRRPLANMFWFASRVACAAIATTLVVFWPWLPRDVGQVLHRVFPVARGLFEDKVANIWCSLSLLYKFQEYVDRTLMFQLCSICTLLAISPFSIAVAMRPSGQQFLLSTCGSALSAYLLSYQVHEKQILIPLVPLALLADQFLLPALWLSLTAAFSLYALLAREHLVVAYVALLVIHLVVVDYFFNLGQVVQQARLQNPRPFAIAVSSVAVAGVLHVAYACGPTFVSKPDLYVVLMSSYSCVHLCLIYAWLLYVSFPESFIGSVILRVTKVVCCANPPARTDKEDSAAKGLAKPCKSE